MLIRMWNVAQRLRGHESGQGMAEYALLAGLIAVVAVSAVTLLGNKLKTTLNTVATSIGSGS